MIRKILTMVAIISLLVSCGLGSTEQVTGENGEPIMGNTIVRPLNVMHTCKTLNVSGNWRVELNDSVQGPTIVVNEDLLPYITIDVDDWRVKLNNKPRMKVRMKDYPEPCLQLPLRNDFSAIRMSGATMLVGASLSGIEDFEVVMSGDASFMVDSLNYMEGIDIVMSGATMFGCKNLKTDELDVEMSGSSNADIAILGMEDEVNVDMSGATNMRLHCEVLTLNLDMSGSSKLDLKGKAIEMNAKILGASWIDSFEEKEEVASANLFIVDIAKVGIKGSAKMRFQCNDKLKVNAMGDAYVLYRGNPKTTVKSSGSARVEIM